MIAPNNLKETESTGNWNPAQDIQKYQPESQIARSAFDRNYYRNLLFLAGIQWIRYERASLQWRPINLPDWFPRTVTNRFAVCVDSMRSVFEQSRPNMLFGPTSGDESDIAAAQAAKSIYSVIEEEVDNEKLRNELAAWLAVAGNGYVVDGYDMDSKYGEKEVPLYGCMPCGQVFKPHEVERGCPICGGEQIMPAMDAMGQPMMAKYPIGKMISEVASPFEMLFDMQSISIEHSPYLIRVKTYPTEVVKGMFPEQSKDIQPSGQDGNMGIYYQRAIAYISGGASSYPSYAAISASGNVERTTVYHIWKQPCRELPYGGEAIVVSEKTMWKGETSTRDDQGRPFYPVTHFKFKNQPGRVAAKTPADDLIAKQIQLNKIDALLQMGMERVSNPCWILPTGIGINEITGIPGEKVWYNPAINGAKPDRIPGMEMPGSAFRYRELLNQDFDDISASYAVLKGDNPKGVPTLGATQMLLERGLSRFSDGLLNWGRGWQRVARNRLAIFKQYATDERVRMILGENSKWDAQKFSSATISGNIDVKLEEGSVQPKSRAYKQMVIGQMLMNGLVDLQDPLIRSKVFSALDAEELVSGLDIDIKDAIKEREEFLQTGQLRPRPLIDNHIVHLVQHIKDCKSDDFFEDWQEPQRQAFIAHIDWHKSFIENEQQKSIMQDPKLRQAEIKTQAMQQENQINLQALSQKKGMEIEAMGLKHQIKIGAAQDEAERKSSENMFGQ